MVELGVSAAGRLLRRSRRCDVDDHRAAAHGEHGAEDAPTPPMAASSQPKPSSCVGPEAGGGAQVGVDRVGAAPVLTLVGRDAGGARR